MVRLEARDQMRPLVFLDMDDVMCLNEQYNSTLMLERFQKSELDYPEMWSGLLDADAMSNLRILHAEYAPQYVISSSWATYLNCEQMCESLKRTQLNIVRENLHEHWRTPRARTSSRRDEIEWWLNEHREPTQPFVVLDDVSSGWSLAHSPLAYDGHVVLCNVKQGFTREKLSEARRVLSRQIQERTNQG